ncbi:MAG: virulence factor [Acidimicrobiia bacterium]
MAQLITILWRDIPAQVTAREGRRKVSIQLDDRFQIAIDKAAVLAGKRTTDEYLGEWHRTTVDCGDDLQAEADTAAVSLEAEFTEQVLSAFVGRGGFRHDDKSESGTP